MYLSILTTVASGLAFASAQVPWWNGDSGSFPSCLSDCSSELNPANIKSQCDNATAVSELNSCITTSSCDASDKETLYRAIAEVCAQLGTTLTAAPEATFSVTSGAFPFATDWPGLGGSANSNLPSYFTSGFGPFGGPNSGWGQGSWGTDGPWVSGPWTSWWGKDGCPGSTWSGWTEGSWSTGAPWTQWTACTATTAGTAVVTNTVTSDGTVSTQTTTSVDVQVNEASSTTSSATSVPTSSATRVLDVDAVKLLAGCMAALGLTLWW